MRLTRHKRQIFLFLAAILVPAAVLVGLATRMLYQDRELAARSNVDRQRLAIDQLRRELSARLEGIRQAEINQLMRPAGAARTKDSANPAAVLIATVDGDRMLLPWEAPAPRESQAFARHKQEGEAAEFLAKDASRAAAAYRLALASAANQREVSEARLLLARTLSKSGEVEEALRQYETLLTAPADARDEQGVGYRFYAAERLLAAKHQATSVVSFLRGELKSEDRLTLPELYLIRSLPDAQFEPEISRRIAQMEQAAALANDFSRVRARIESGATSSGSVWVPFGASSGEDLWLVTTIPSQPPLPERVLAVSSAGVAPPGVKLGTRLAGAATGTDGLVGEQLGDSFPGLYLEWTDRRMLETINTGSSVGIWVAGLALVLGVALFGGYLLLRDVNRDVRMTEVRAQFVASVSHELKTPLTAIRMFAETLAMGRSRDERTKSEYLETIVNESERLARLVDNVLDFSKIEQGKKIYRLRTTCLGDIADSAIRALQFPLTQQGFHLRFSAEHDIPELQADADALQQAILNLLTNAMKYSGDSRDIDLRLAMRNNEAVIEVLDRGLGLAPDERGRVFEKFYRAPSHESRSIAGTGLGLTLVAHIAAAHGGRVEVQSAPGEGSTFRIFLPVKPASIGHVAAEVHV